MAVIATLSLELSVINFHAGRVEAVNPWELEVDPDFERTEDELRRDQEAQQRALRAAALLMRRCAARLRTCSACNHCCLTPSCRDEKRGFM